MNCLTILILGDIKGMIYINTNTHIYYRGNAVCDESRTYGVDRSKSRWGQTRNGTTPAVITVKDGLNGEVVNPVPGVFGLKIKLDNAKKEFSELTNDSILVLKVEGAEDVELTYYAKKDEFRNSNIQGKGYTIDALEKATVELKKQ